MLRMRRVFNVGLHYVILTLLARCRGTVGAVKRMLNASGAGEKDKDEISLKLTLNTDKLSLE